MLAGSRIDSAHGFLQGLSGTDDIKTGRPTLGGELGAKIGRSARDYLMTPQKNSNYNAMMRFEERTVSAPARQIVSTDSIGKQMPDLYLPPKT